MKAVMYHYVQPCDPNFPRLKSLHIEDFKKQLDYFEAKYGFVDKEDFYAAIREKRNATGIVLTFDDGLKCHYDHVFKELLSRGLWGIFYVSSSPLANQQLLDVHKSHVLLAKYPAKDVYEVLSEILVEHDIDDIHKKAFESLTYKSQINDDYTLLVKRTINYFMRYTAKRKILEQAFSMFGLNEDDIARNFYLSKEEINEMNEAGMIIGSHTINHPVMSRLTREMQSEEIVGSKKFLEKIIQPNTIDTFCFPYGGEHSFDDNTLSLLEEHGFNYSFSVEPRDIVIKDLCYAPNALPRYDCNCFPFGQVRES